MKKRHCDRCHICVWRQNFIKDFLQDLTVCQLSYRNTKSTCLPAFASQETSSGMCCTSKLFWPSFMLILWCSSSVLREAAQDVKVVKIPLNRLLFVYRVHLKTDQFPRSIQGIVNHGNWGERWNILRNREWAQFSAPWINMTCMYENLDRAASIMCLSFGTKSPNLLLYSKCSLFFLSLDLSPNWGNSLHQKQCALYLMKNKNKKTIVLIFNVNSQSFTLQFTLTTYIEEQ